MADDKNTSLLTPAHHIRLECVKLAYRHDRSSEDIVQRAKNLEEYVNGTAAKAVATDRQAEPDGPI